jgi:Fe2+ transport system protein FeoA
MITPHERKNEITLYKLPLHKLGEIVEILDSPTNNISKEKLSELGLTKGTVIEKINEMPFQGAIQIKARGISMAIGHSMAQKIILKPL